MDEELKAGNDRGPLHGIPIGIKDIFDVKGLPTACGAKRWVDRIAEGDAWARGSTPRGRGRDHGQDRHDALRLARSAGHSQSLESRSDARRLFERFGRGGGLRDVLRGIGTQTGGSITRPASFCGVAGMKPNKTASLWLMRGVLPFAPSLDHVGPIARTVDDLRLLFEAMGEKEFLNNEPDDYPPRDGPVKLGRLRGFFDRRATPAVLSVLEEAVQALDAQGADIVELDDPVDFEKVLRDHRHRDRRRGREGAFRLVRRGSRRLSTSHPRPHLGGPIPTRAGLFPCRRSQ